MGCEIMELESVQGYQLNNLRFADNIDLIEERPEKLQANIKTLQAAGEDVGLMIKIGKTKALCL
jgi:hypothetical protein